MTKRLYVVSKENEPVALVRATSQPQAINHVVRSQYTAAPASAEDVAVLLAEHKIEDANS